LIKGRGKIYHLHEIFDTFELARGSLLSEHIWSKTNKKYEKLTKTHKIFYRCNQVKSRNKVQCSSACVIILPATSTKAEVHRTTCPHDHIQRNMSVSIEAQLAIDKMFEAIKTLKPSKILENLDNENVQILKENPKRQEDPNLQKETDKPIIKIPILADLNNYLARYKKKHLINGQAGISISTFNSNPPLLDIFDEDIDDVEDVEVEKASQVQAQVQVKRRGRPPLSLEEVERRAALKANEKLKKQASKRAKTT
jgi:hypothetical protein